MGIMSSRRSAAGGFGLAAFACAAALALAGQATAATTAYPAGGSGFAADAEGWVGSDHACSVTLLTIPLPVLNTCTSTTVHDPGAGNPPGSITARTNVAINLLSLFTGTSTWTSPEFTVPAGAVGGATLALDRALAAGGGLLDVGLTSTYTAALQDVTAGTSADVLTEALTPENADFAARGAGVQVVPGHTYRIAIRTQTTSTVGLGLINGDVNTRFDNVALTVESGSGGGDPTTGGDFPVGTPGVTIVKSSLTSSEIARLIDRFGINADVGKGPGGSLVPLASCTVVGTAGNDRILGSRGNDVICGLGGNDVVIGGGGRDLVDGANGADRLDGGAGGDLLLGLRGNDRLSGGAGRDGLGGGAGRDVLRGGRGADRFSGRTGPDVLYARDRTRDSVVGGPGRDRARVDRAVASSKRATKRRADRVRGVERVR
jgi:Ca2+-binding RTX toxin-like protein